MLVMEGLKVKGFRGDQKLKAKTSWTFFSLQISDYEDYTAPLLTHCREMKKKHPELPLFLMGHSMGGLISILSVLEAQVIFSSQNMKPGYLSFSRISLLD